MVSPTDLFAFQCNSGKRKKPFLIDQRHVIVLQPIGEFTKDELAVLGQLRAFTSAYFQLPVRVPKSVPLPNLAFRQRGSGSLAWTELVQVTPSLTDPQDLTRVVDAMTQGTADWLALRA